MIRFDDRVRTERYFTATLLPIILFHQDPQGGTNREAFSGLRAFVELIRERGARGLPVEFDFSDPEVMTEFHIARDTDYYRKTPRVKNDDKKDAPDLVIVLGEALIVVEAKFFGATKLTALQIQLESQRRQVQILVDERPHLVPLYIALMPDATRYREACSECNALITWQDIAVLAANVLGPSHYVTHRLENAVLRHKMRPPVKSRVLLNGFRVSHARNYNDIVSYEVVIEKARVEGNAIQIGYVGGEKALAVRGLAAIKTRRWKWRRHDGYPDQKPNWIEGETFVNIIDRLSNP